MNNRIIELAEAYKAFIDHKIGFAERMAVLDFIYKVYRHEKCNFTMDELRDLIEKRYD